jgi:hypothetical protein
MTSEQAQEAPWPRRRWWVLIAGVFATQIALIFWLGRPQRVRAPRADFAPVLQLASPTSPGLLAFADPTLFALPHQEGFSGRAWLTITEPDLHPFWWDEAPSYLALDPASLGGAFRNYMSTNQPGNLPEMTQPEFKFKIPEVLPSTPLVTESTLRLSGELAGRRLLVAPELRPWTNSEILSNSVVQVLVGADGRPISATLLRPPGSAVTDADRYALRSATKVRFESINGADPLNPLAALALGQMIFEWQTVPQPSTNNPPDVPASK